MASSRSGLKPFVTKFHGKTQLTSTEFMEVFRKYDKDGKLCLNSVEYFLAFTCDSWAENIAKYWIRLADLF